MVNSQTPVGHIVMDHPECAAVLQRHHLDYCCKGHLPLEQACRERGAELPRVLEDLSRAIEGRETTAAQELESRPTGELLAQLAETQHRHVSETLPFLVPLSLKVARVHGSRHANLREVHETVVELEETLEELLEWREKELFPLMLGGTGPHLHTELQAMVAAHMVVSRLFEQLRDAADGYRIPEDSCSSYRTLYRELETLEAEQLAQLRLEQQVLMPRFVTA